MRPKKKSWNMFKTISVYFTFVSLKLQKHVVQQAHYHFGVKITPFLGCKLPCCSFKVLKPLFISSIIQ